MSRCPWRRPPAEERRVVRVELLDVVAGLQHGVQVPLRLAQALIGDPGHGSAVATGSSSRLNSNRSNRAPATLCTRSTPPPRPGHRRRPRPTEPEAPARAALPSRTPPTRPAIGEPGWRRRPDACARTPLPVGGPKRWARNRPRNRPGTPRSSGPVAQVGRLVCRSQRSPHGFPGAEDNICQLLIRNLHTSGSGHFASACAHADARGSGCQSAASTTVPACQRI